MSLCKQVTAALSITLLTTVVCVSRTDAAGTHNTLTAKELAEGWVSLFDGKTIFGWTAANKADWKVVDGVIVVTSGEKGLLHTNTQFADYVLRLDFRSAKGTNSGVFLRTSPSPKNPKDGCYELNIAGLDSSPFPTGSLVARKKYVKAGESSEWRTFEVTAKGDRITVKLDGKQVLDYTDPNPTRRGFIGLQKNEGKVEFRNVKLRPLSQQSIFNGKDLDGWRPYPDHKAKVSVTDKGELWLRGGRGQLETLAKYGDFTLQMDVFSGSKGSNSGVFFRSIPGEYTNGYECQLQNTYGPKGGLKNLVDCGTGGICRRQRARKIVAEDLKWYQLTLIADGPHIAAWVNGHQVSDFTDKRKKDKNPRRGLRTAPGTLILQVHDATTDYRFRNLRAAEMAKRE